MLLPALFLSFINIAAFLDPPLPEFSPRIKPGTECLISETRCGPGICGDAKIYKCCGEALCRRGNDCIDNHCMPPCEENMQICGDNGCFDPKKKKCCSLGKLLYELDDDCTLDKKSVNCGNKICPGPGTQKRCNHECYDPSTEQCCLFTNTICGLDQNCGPDDGQCVSKICEKGEKRCGKYGRCYNPDISTCCADEATLCNTSTEDCKTAFYQKPGAGAQPFVTCCPHNWDTCGVDCYDSANNQCCLDADHTALGLCGKDQVCCGGGCCDTGQSCGKDAKGIVNCVGQAAVSRRPSSTEGAQETTTTVRVSAGEPPITSATTATTANPSSKANRCIRRELRRAIDVFLMLLALVLR